MTEYYNRTLDSFADEIITRCSGPTNGWYHAVLDRGPYDISFDFAAYGYGRTREEAIARCASEIRRDARGIGKFAPHDCFRGYTFRFQLCKYWSEKESASTS